MSQNSPLKSIRSPPVIEKEIIDNRSFFLVICKKEYKKNIIKKVCKEIEDIWLHAYKCNGNKENIRELKKLIFLEKNKLLIL